MHNMWSMLVPGTCGGQGCNRNVYKEAFLGLLKCSTSWLKWWFHKYIHVIQLIKVNNNGYISLYKLCIHCINNGYISMFKLIIQWKKSTHIHFSFSILNYFKVICKQYNVCEA